jgi:hypothetical protein
MIFNSLSSGFNQHSQSKRLEKIAPILTGALIYFIVVGTNTLRFENFAWLMQSEDPATHYTGWMFFRNSPWTFPIGANPDYGLEIGSSIFYSDSLPLFAFAFKLLSPILPSVFQYFGLWILLCFILQAWFAWRLVSLISTSMTIKFCATALFLFSPPLLARLYGHDTLAGHWLILAGLYLCLAKDIPHKKWKWLALAVIASLVHSYLLAMVVLLWISDTLRRLVVHDLNPLSLLYEI